MRTIYVQHNIDSIETIARKSVYNFSVRLAESENTIIQTIQSSLYSLHSNMFVRWNQVLYL